MGMTHHRPDRVGDRIREELARLLNEEARDPGLGFITLTGVDLSPDMRYARVFVSVLGSDPQPTLDALERATPFLRRGLARCAGLRFTPRLSFALDPSVAAGSRVERLLQEIHEQNEPLSDAEEGHPRSDDPGESD
jgi:ribosome-binding factor A